MKKQKVSQIALVGLLTLAGLTQKANALPMFTQQTGMDCTGCHMQHMPRLNKFGRKFAASGMTMSQNIEDLNKTSDMDINPSLLIKSKFTRTWDKPDGKGAIKEDDTNDGDLSPVRMATFYMGGRVNENVGGLLNLGWRKNEGESISGRVTYANEIEDGYWGTTVYSTSNLGPFSGMEFYNTGLYKPLRTFDMWNYSNANQSTRIGAKSATGLQVYCDKDNLINDGDHIFATVGIYTAAQDNADADIRMAGNLLPFARIAYEHPIGDYNVIVGAFAIVGGEHVSDTQAISVNRETYGVDLQIEGDIADKESSLTLTNVFRNKVDFTGIGAQLSEDTEDIYNDSFSVEGAVSVTPEIVAKLGYMTYNDLSDYKYSNNSSQKINVKDLDYAINVGVDYAFIVTEMPLKLAVEYAWMNPELDRVKNYEAFMATFTLAF
ncbi:hypothetical protein ACFLRS_01050 [Campylobacterota bacterium]